MHDQLFKDLLVAFFGQLLELIVPALARRLDLESIHFLRQELFLDMPQGRRREADLIAEIPRRRAPDKGVTVHVEVERRARNNIGKRLWRYRMQIKLRHDLSLLTLVLFLDGGGPGVVQRTETEQIGDLETATFSYFAWGLGQSSAEEYLLRPEPLAWALSALMRRKTLRASEHKLACLRAIARVKIDEARRFLLVNCVETYLQLSEEEEKAYESLLALEENEEINTMEQTWADRMREEGRQEGRQEGQRQGMQELLRQLLEERFGPLPKNARQRIATIKAPEELQRLARDVLAARSLGELGLA